MDAFIDVITRINDTIWANAVLFGVLGAGVLFTVWSAFGQYRALTHGTAVTRGKYDNPDDPGAINHFQALSAALSATVGLGNIGGVALAIALGGPGAVFWMWIVGFFGMALKMTEVTLAMLYRNTDDPDNPHGGAMWVVSKGFAAWNPRLKWVGATIGAIFCLTLLVSAFTGGNMFQSWNVADVTHAYFGVPQIATGIVLAIVVGLVIIGGIKRIGAVAGRLVPVMCLLYLLSAAYVIVMKIDLVPEMLKLIVVSAFRPHEAQGAFIGGTAGYAFLWGMKRALFSNEAGQGSAPIAHSAAKTNEPVREAVVSGLEPFIDTIIVCTLTSLVILSSGLWNREPELVLDDPPEAATVQEVELAGGDVLTGQIVRETDGTMVFRLLGADEEALRDIPRADVVAVRDVEDTWTFPITSLPEGEDWVPNTAMYAIVSADENEEAGNTLHQLAGTLLVTDDRAWVHWDKLRTERPPTFRFDDPGVTAGGVYFNYKGATLTAKAFDSVTEGLGKWLVTLAAWLFAISTMISWSYYGEQGIVYLFGERLVVPYKYLYCGLIIVAAIPQLVKTEAELDALTSLGTGVMLWANIPIMLIFGYQAMNAYHRYIGRLKRGEFHPHKPPHMTDIVRGDD